MKVSTSTVSDILSHLRDSFQGNDAKRNFGDEEPFRSELYNSDQMDRHGKVVARSHKLQKRNSSDQLLKRLDENEKTLLEVRNLLVESIREGKTVSPGAEWLLDNFYLLEEQVVIARKHLPKGYSEALPCLADGISSGMPRVYDIALEIISHSDGRVDAKSLGSFISAYQTITVLTLGELWAIPIMIRLTVIENLRRVAGRMALDMIDRNLADYWADRMKTTMKEEPADLILTIADMARSRPVLGGSFVAGLTRRLQGKGPALALPLSWMEQQLSAAGGGGSIDLVRQENRKQAADQVSVRNSIGTLRFLGATDWRKFVEALSMVERILRRDRSGTYPLMDFATRDRYRHVVESISRSCPLSETEVAEKVIELADGHEPSGPESRRRGHVGYYLIDKGLECTEQAAGARHGLGYGMIRAAGRMPVFLYVFSIVSSSLAAAAAMVHLAFRNGIHDPLPLSLLGIVAVSGSSQLMVSLVNWLSTLLVKPHPLPRMDFSGGIPGDCRTLVVVPTMLSGKAYIEELIEGLEIRFLANREDNLHFGLLTDFLDADSETLPEDDGLLELARTGIEGLNQRYSPPDDDIFFLFHRPRTWNARERKWMGYERKRGKLSALNALLRERGRSRFSSIAGNDHLLSQVRYVITLDSDTRLPREAARKFIATMAHPLNQALYDREKRRVTDGYGILQPRVASAMPTAAASLYLRMQGDVSGIDPYTRVSSDVYQDVFGEGSFIGKGIYDVDVFEQAVHQVFPENRILSHDLLEGCYARCGLLSDVFLYEENPAQYWADMKRFHRWVRGDWQVGAWMLPFIPAGSGRLVRNRLSALSRWKIFDNLRRSLVPLSLLSLLLLGWSVLPFPWIWTLSVAAILLLPAIASAGWQLLRKPIDLTLRAHLSEVGAPLRDILIRFLFGIAVLPHEAFRFADAVIRTTWRIAISGRNLLEWTSSASASRNVRNAGNGIASAYGSMWMPPLLATLAGPILVWLANPDALLIAAPVLLLWLSAPLLAWRLSAPESGENRELPGEQERFLHKSARKTWSFFERFVTADENWLPPDNFQEEPIAAIAHRTSPTNMGLSLLANLAAHDFGYISGGELLARSRCCLRSMLKLERHKGHFLNWYDTLSLLPLQPRYVSTVDSGNLVGHLLILRQGLLSLANQPVFGGKAFAGLATTAGIIQELSEGPHGEPVAELLAALERIAAESGPLSLVMKQLDGLAALGDALPGHEAPGETKVRKWTSRFSQQVHGIRDDLAKSAPWQELLPVPERFENLAAIDCIPSPGSILDMPDMFMPHVDRYEKQEMRPEERDWLLRFRALLTQGARAAGERVVLLEQLAGQCERLSTVDYDFLFDKSTSLLRIGYNVDEHRKDDGSYDLLASEARLGIFTAIAQGKLPQESWFALGRLLTDSGGDPILLSWSGSMFEYLMPQLVMPSYENTLLHQTNKATVKRQMEYAEQRGIPWGISESAYNRVDANLNYQYRAFGVPGLGLKRGLEEDVVIAPYATMLALMVSPGRACSNLQSMSQLGFEGEHGFFEAIDFTASRLPRGKTHSIVKSYMVHHQGMSLLSLAYALLDRPMQRRFVSELRFQATVLLLQERIPRATLFYAHTADLVRTYASAVDVQARKIATAHTPMPEIQLLGNSRYQVMITNSGGGYSRWKGLAITRWREDSTRDDRGIFCYVKDADSGRIWSNTYQPTREEPEAFEAIFSQGHVEFRRRDHGIETRTEIVISPEDDAEMRRVRLTNRSPYERVLEVTSYAEIVMASHASDEAHSAFSNLFVQTRIMPEVNAVFCTRRQRSEGEAPPWMFHLMDVSGTAIESASFETDRMRFIGRGRTLEHPQALDAPLLSGSQGAVLDPIMSIRHRIRIKPNQTATIDLIFGISETRAACEALMLKYRDKHLKNRAFELSWTHSQVLLRQINATEADAQLYDRLAAAVIHASPALRAEAGVIQNNLRGQSGLWSHSVSGDLPIVLLHIFDPKSIDLVKQMVQAHAYWRLKGLAVDLVIWNEDHGTYRQVLQDRILGLITADADGNPGNGKPGRIFVKSVDQLSSEDRILFESVARVIIHDGKGTLAEQVNGHYPEKALPNLLAAKPVSAGNIRHDLALPEGLLFFNGIGGFMPDGKEYKIITDGKGTTPAPWVNVIANADFGTVISESGSAYTWAVNAHEYRLTPWSNDPVSDIGGEAFYLRDEETGRFWSPSPFPAKGMSPYVTTHGFGYTLFEHSEQGIHSEMRVFVDRSSPIKFIALKIRNLSGRERKCSATGFLEIILGDVRSRTNMHVLSEQDADTGALLMRNRYNSAFAERVTFFKVDGANPSFTADRAEFIGRNGTLKDPQAMRRKRLSGRSGAGLDPCAALQVKFDLLDGAEQEITFQLGNEENAPAAIALIRKFLDVDETERSFADAKAYWRDVLGAVQVATPDSSLNILANGWLTYQTLACRIYARSGFYQSGGAFGFRDQLQDAMAFMHARPGLVRKQILLSASRQFAEGDVQHWWHPPEGRGVRTRCSDDLLWLPFVVSRYVAAIGDTGVLAMPVGFLESRPLAPEEDSLYDLPLGGNQNGTLYEHCVRAIRLGLRLGEHGLPLIGSGDWNDGMDQVGNKGRGESVWLAFFLYDVLVRFSKVAIGYGDPDFAAECKKRAATLQSSIEGSSWDGEWYLRAFFDDGKPLGSKENAECRIDAIAQSWSVLSGAGGAARRAEAMASLDRHLVRRDLKLIQLLDPPFGDHGPNPGYIKGYVPGVRENGGQYSHAAIWSLMAFAALGDRKKVWELFSMIHPISHSSDAAAMAAYKVEPYVMAADIYANESHPGRGGWTWYTGSSGWMYQFILESFLGLELQVDRLKFRPCFPLEWPSVGIAYRHGSSTYRFTVFQTGADAGSWWRTADTRGEGDTVALLDDGLEHEVEVHVRIPG